MFQLCLLLNVTNENPDMTFCSSTAGTTTAALFLSLVSFFVQCTCIKSRALYSMGCPQINNVIHIVLMLWKRHTSPKKEDVSTDEFAGLCDDRDEIWESSGDHAYLCMYGLQARCLLKTFFLSLIEKMNKNELQMIRFFFLPNAYTYKVFQGQRDWTTEALGLVSEQNGIGIDVLLSLYGLRGAFNRSGRE